MSETAAPTPEPLSATRESEVEKASSLIERQRLAELVMAMTAIPSPTGEEAELASYAAGQLEGAGLRAEVQHLDDNQANAIGRLAPSGPRAGSGPRLLLYAPIDTLTTGLVAEDIPAVAPAMRPDLLPVPQRQGELVWGLGASNPKGHAACVVAAAEAIARSGAQLAGELCVGLGAGGMPTNAWRQGGRRNVGQGVGCAFMLEQGLWPDLAVVAKPGWSVSREEVGLSWFDVWVSGTHTYVGSRHKLAYRNPIVDAAELATRLEAWFPRYAERHRSGEVLPQGIIGAIEGGFMRMAAVTPAACRFRVDLRTSPRTTPGQARRELEEALTEIAAELGGISWRLEQVLAIPAGSTAAEHFLVRAAVAAFEAVSGEAHVPPSDMSGATDANILRTRSIPTVRIGMPKVAEAPFAIDFQAGMNTVDLLDMERLTRVLVRLAIDTCSRNSAEVL